MEKHEIARLFRDIGLILELKGESPFKSRAYDNAAHTIETLPEDLAGLVASGRIRDRKGIGQAIAEKLGELVGTGRLGYYEKLKETVPPGLLEMSAIPGLGPKKVAEIWRQLGITTVGELEYACNENRLVSLSGFGQKTQDKILDGLAQFKRRRGFHLYANAAREADLILQAVRRSPGVGGAALVGELRRRMEVVRSIVLLAAAERPESVLDGLRQVEGVTELTLTGQKITAKSGLGLVVEVDVGRAISGTALLAATGSEQHLTQLAERAAQRGMPWDSPALSTADSEEVVYAALGLPFIAPELREGLGEIEAAEAGLLGPLVETGQIQGIFHTHTTDSDGAASLDEMVEAARALGYRYIGISDHSQSAFYANGLKEDRVREQHAAIEALRKRVSGIVIFKGIEADILPDGSMDYPDEVLARFDFVIGSVHSRFTLPEAEQTARVVRALAHPLVTMLGHPTGRLLLSRDGYRIDMTRVLDAVKEHGKVVEINANPHRLDLDWRWCRYARTQGVKTSINPDAHATAGLQDVPFGVNVARKGGLIAADVVNTRGPEEILAALAPGRRARGT